MLVRVKQKEEILNRKITQVLELENCEGRHINITGRGEEGNPEPALMHMGGLFLRNKNGKTIPVSLRVSPVRGKRDFSRGSIFVIRDLTDWRMLMVSMSVYFLSMASEDMDNAIHHVLEKIRNFVDVDLSCVLQFSGKGREMEVTHLKSSKQAESMDLAAFINHEQNECLFQKLANFENIIVNNGSELSNCGHIQSYIISPMVNTGVLIGVLFLGSVNRKKNWPEDIGELLEITEEMIVNLLERKWSKKELARLDTELHMLVDRANVPIFVVDTGGRIIVWNSNIEQITGYSNSDAVGKNFQEHFIKRENRKSMEELIDNVFHGRETQTLETGFHTADHGDVVILLNCFPRYNQDGEIIGATGIGQDITVRKQAELRNQVLTQALINAQEKERQRISLELHDSVAQLLSTARITTETTGALEEKKPYYLSMIMLYSGKV